MTRLISNRFTNTTHKQKGHLFRASSEIHSHGVFASRFLPAGSAVIACGGIFLSGSEVGTETRAMQIGRDLYLAEHPERSAVDDFINHSCDPNLGFVHGTLTLHALRDIRRGDEVAFDYSTCMNEPGWSIPCRCGSRRCRGEVTSFCDLTTREQRRLATIALSYLRPRALRRATATT